MRKIIYTVALIAPMLFMACETEEETNNPPQEKFESLEDFWNSKEVTAETKVFKSEDGLSFTTKKGSKVIIPANAIVHHDGSPVVGDIDFKIKEVFSNTDIIFSGVFPVAFGDNVLNSGGEFFLEVKQNGENLTIADGMEVELDIPAQAEDPNMQLFMMGQEEDMDSVDWGEPVDSAWGQNGQLTNSSFTFNSADGMYECNLDSLSWGNIDAFNWSITYFDVTFNCIGVDGINSSNTNVFSIFKEQNSVWPTGTSYWGSIANNIVTETHLADVPMNVVVISVIDGELYYGLLDVTPQQNNTYDITMKKITSAELDVIINELP